MFTYLHRVRVHPEMSDEMVTKQSSKDECDIYKILQQYQRTGILTHVTPHQPRYEALPEVEDYQAALNQVMEAEAAFLTLPAAVRDEYGNDPRIFLAALTDPAQRDRLMEIGVFQKPDAPPIPPPAAAQEAS